MEDLTANSLHIIFNILIILIASGIVYVALQK